MVWDDPVTISRLLAVGAAKVSSKQPQTAKDYNDREMWTDVAPDQLLRACAGPSSRDAWEEFMRRYHSLILAAATRVSSQWGSGASDQIDDVVQEIYLGLCANQARILTSFEEDRPEAIYGYLKVVATNLARDVFRKRSAAKRGEHLTARFEESSEVPAPNNDLERRLTLAKVDEVLLSQTQTENGKRDRIIFRMYYLYGMTAQEIAELPGIGLTAKGVEGVLHRITKVIRQTFAQAQGIGGVSRSER
jgi:RNA polymerase sigma-70 factor, ECF subfamily